MAAMIFLFLILPDFARKEKSRRSCQKSLGQSSNSLGRVLQESWKESRKSRKSLGRVTEESRKSLGSVSEDTWKSLGNYFGRSLFLKSNVYDCTNFYYFKKAKLFPNQQHAIDQQQQLVENIFGEIM
jgi:hypothetical protein